MIHILFTKHKTSALFIFCLIAASLACNALTSSTPGTSDQQKITIESDNNYGLGQFDFPSTKDGLSELSSYTSNLTIAFDGTRDGNTEKWSKTYKMLATNNPKARQWTIVKTGNGSTPESVFKAEISGTDYERQGEGACTARAIQEGSALSDLLETASFLTSVIGAEEAGSETMNAIPSNHYTFDQHALGEEGLTESTGEMWVASEGGYIVKYLLSRKGKSDYFGEGIEGTLTMDYELTEVNKKEPAITLPDDCPPGFIDAPLLPDAINTSKIPGVLAYDTSSRIADAAAFYQKNIPDLGWQAQDKPAITDKIAILTYQQGNKLMIIIIKPNEAKTQVRITVSKLQ